MLSPLLVALVALIYMLALFALAFYGDQRRAQGRSLIDNPYIYTLSLAVYCSSWTFYGSVGKAATSGVIFLATYLGPTLAATSWWFIVRKLLRLCKANHVTTLPDFLVLRYGRSSLLGMVATVGILLAVVPYIGLQLKAVADTFTILVNHGNSMPRRLSRRTTRPFMWPCSWQCSGFFLEPAIWTPRSGMKAWWQPSPSNLWSNSLRS
jgi:sigma-B regulation protein RsbU (phosphoserine phosphatase)